MAIRVFGMEHEFEKLHKRLENIEREIRDLKRELVKSEIAKRNREIFALRRAGLTLKEIGTLIPISGNRIRQIEGREERKLRKAAMSQPEV